MRNYLYLYREDQTKEVGPQNNGQCSLPEAEVEEPDSKQPPGNPKTARRAMVFDLYLFHSYSVAKFSRTLLLPAELLICQGPYES
jgi:hypothetical protein